MHPDITTITIKQGDNVLVDIFFESKHFEENRFDVIDRVFIRAMERFYEGIKKDDQVDHIKIETKLKDSVTGLKIYTKDGKSLATFKPEVILTNTSESNYGTSCAAM